jgi:hypothetical protein
MLRAWRTAAVRLSLWTLVFASLAMALVQPAQAGTADAPEIQDPADDQAVLGTVPAQDQFGGNSDILAGWISGETATDVHLYILSQGDFTDGTAGPYTFTFHLTVAGTAYTATVTTGAPQTAGGVATAVTVANNIADLTVPKSAIGSPVSGATMTALFIQSAGGSPSQVPQGVFGDRAPDSGNGADYIFNGGGGGSTTPGDSDNDGMNDTCEIKYFGNTTAQNASGDPDQDGLTNGQECALGTDPTKADTDGDGTNDKDDSAPLDPTKGGTNSTSSSSSSSSSQSSSSSSSSSSLASHSATGGSSTGGKTKGAPKDLNEAMDRLTSDPGYLGLSSGGFLAVLIMCIIGLAVRWSL